METQSCASHRASYTSAWNNATLLVSKHQIMGAGKAKRIRPAGSRFFCPKSLAPKPLLQTIAPNCGVFCVTCLTQLMSLRQSIQSDFRRLGLVYLQYGGKEGKEGEWLEGVGEKVFL